MESCPKKKRAKNGSNWKSLQLIINELSIMFLLSLKSISHLLACELVFKFFFFGTCFHSKLWFGKNIRIAQF